MCVAHLEAVSSQEAKEHADGDVRKEAVRPGSPNLGPGGCATTVCKKIEGEDVPPSVKASRGGTPNISLAYRRRGEAGAAQGHSWRKRAEIHSIHRDCVNP